MSNVRSDAGSESTTTVHASLKSTSVVGPFKRNILEHSVFCLENTFCTFAASLAKTGSFQLCDPVWFSLVLPNTTRFMPSGAITFKCPSNSILSSKFSQFNPFPPLHVEAGHFIFLTTVRDAPSCI